MKALHSEAQSCRAAPLPRPDTHVRQSLPPHPLTVPAVVTSHCRQLQLDLMSGRSDNGVPLWLQLVLCSS